MIQQSNPTLGYIPGQNHNSKRCMHGASLVAQWQRVHQPIQETWVRSLVQEDPTCQGATKPVGHNY